MQCCAKCGTELVAGKRFCMECGAPASPAPQPGKEAAPSDSGISHSSRPSPPRNPHYQESAAARQSPAKRGRGQDGGQGGRGQPSFAFSDPDAEPPSYSKYAVLSTGDYLGIMLLMLIPVVNLILLIVWACGGCQKIAKRNWARAALAVALIVAVLTAITGFALQSVLMEIIRPLLSALG